MYLVYVRYHKMELQSFVFILRVLSSLHALTISAHMYKTQMYTYTNIVPYIHIRTLDFLFLRSVAILLRLFVHIPSFVLALATAFRIYGLSFCLSLCLFHSFHSHTYSLLHPSPCPCGTAAAAATEKLTSVFKKFDCRTSQ